MSTYSNAHANAKKCIFDDQSQEIGLSLVPFQMIFEAPQSELFRFKFHSLGSKILKIPEFNLVMNNFEHFIELYLEVFWTWRNGDGFWQCHSSLHLIGLAKRSHLYSVSEDLNLSFQSDYLWNIFADGSSPAVNPFLVLPKPLLNLKMHFNAWNNMVSYETIISCQFWSGWTSDYLFVW